MSESDRGRYTIGVVAEMLDLHPQTLRLYERRGLVNPSRSDGNTRLYSDDDIERLRLIVRLTQDMGVNLAGVEVIIRMREKLMSLQLQHRELIEFMLRYLKLHADEGEEVTSLVPVDIRTLIQKRSGDPDES